MASVSLPYSSRPLSQTLPRDISKFHSLKVVEAESNQLSSLPGTVARLPLERLSLRRNSLSSTEVVDAFLAPPTAPAGSLPLNRSLRDLDLSSNGLAEVPLSIFSCRGVQVLSRIHINVVEIIVFYFDHEYPKRASDSSLISEGMGGGTLNPEA